MEGNKALIIGYVTLVVVGLVVLGVALGGVGSDTPGDTSADELVEQTPLTAENADIQQFDSDEAFYDYVSAGQGTNRMTGGVTTAERQTSGDEVAVEDGGGDGAEVSTQDSDREIADGPDRIAESNVQVAELDEPDIVKTDGERFYYAPREGGAVTPRLVREEGHNRKQSEPGIHVVDASEPGDPGQIGRIDASGEMLQTGDRLVVFEKAEGRIVGYNVTDPENPAQTWEQPLEAQLVTARETGGQLYVVTETQVGLGTECPLEPMGNDAAIDCGDVYAPRTQASVDGTYTAFSIDAESGEIEDSVSFVGTGGDTVVYMSPSSLYITYTTGASETDMLTEYISSSEVVPDRVTERVREIQSYDISERSKAREIGATMQAWLRSLPDQQRQDINQELSAEFDAYVAERQTELTQTSVVRVDITDRTLEVAATGTVPGEPLNQFALSEHEGTLRVTTTIPPAGSAESVNNLYVLDSESLERQDEITGMGKGQRVYAVRYVDDTAYVVTFRQVDPFYVIDFEDPRDPELLGDLKLPGFSSYLHPADDNHVIGIGQEDRQVKATLYDVTDPTDPVVGDDLVLPERFSAVEQSHHAFLIDRRHEVFFLPAQDRGLVVDYSGGELEVVASVAAEGTVERARYVDDYLYVFAGDEVIVLDQTNWKRTTTLELEG